MYYALETTNNNIKEPRGLKHLKIKDKVNYYNYTDGFISTIIFDIFTKL